MAFTSTKDLMLPATITGSYPRPRWYDVNLWGRPLDTAMMDRFTGDTDEEGMGRQRIECLAAERVALYHFEGERQGIVTAVDDGDERAGMHAAQLHAGEVVVAFAIAGIDRVVVRAIGFDHLAEGGEGIARERFGGEDARIRHRLGRNLGWRLTSL